MNIKAARQHPRFAELQAAAKRKNIARENCSAERMEQYTAVERKAALAEHVSACTALDALVAECGVGTPGQLPSFFTA